MSKVTLSALEKLYADRVMKKDRNLSDVPASFCAKVKIYVESESQADSQEIQAETTSVESETAPVEIKPVTRRKKKSAAASKV